MKQQWALRINIKLLSDVISGTGHDPCGQSSQAKHSSAKTMSMLNTTSTDTGLYKNIYGSPCKWSY